MAHDARAIANEIIRRGIRQQRAFTHLQIQKLVYYCQGWMLGIFNEPMIKQDIVAWRYGPVVRQLYNALSRHGDRPVSPIRLVRRPELTPQQSLIIDQVMDQYAGHSGVTLSEMTHQPGTPWDKTIRDRGEGQVIESGLIKAHFDEKYEKHLNDYNIDREANEQRFLTDYLV